MLHLRKEALVPAPIGGGAPSVGSGPPDDLNDETPMLHLEPTLGSSPIVSNVHIVLYSLLNTFRRFSEGAPLPPPRLPCNRFPYGLASPTDAYARGLRKMLTPPPLTSEFVGMVSYAPASFHDLMDDELESDGSSIGDIVAPSHPLSHECATANALGQPPMVVESL